MKLMRKHIYNILIALAGGLFGISILWVIFRSLEYLNLALSPFPPTPLGEFLFLLFVVSFVEEGTKFLLIKQNIGQHPYGGLMGFGFGTGESFLKRPIGDFGFVPERRAGTILLHTITAGIIAYFVKKNKSLLGLLIAIILHTAFNLITPIST